MPPFRALGLAKRVTLTARDFKAGNQVLGILTTAAYFDVAMGHLAIFRGGDNFRFFVKACFAQNVQGSAAGSRAVDLGAANLDLVRSPRPAPAFPTANHPDVLVYTSADGVSWARATVTAIDFDLNTVTYDKPAGIVKEEIYFLPGNGEFELRVLRPMGSDVASAKLFGGSLRALHETNQVNVRSAPQFGALGREYPLPPQFRLELAVRSTAAVVMNDRSEHDLSLPYFDTAIATDSPQQAAQLAAEAEVKLRGGWI